MSTEDKIDMGQEGPMTKRRRNGFTYPKNWRRCRECEAIVPLGVDHNCEPVTPTAEDKQPEPDHNGHDE